jgi:hypothetical protein
MDRLDDIDLHRQLRIRGKPGPGIGGILPAALLGALRGVGGMLGPSSKPVSSSQARSR